MAWNIFSIIGLITMILAIILVVIGIILYEISIRNRKGQSGWTYALLIIGAIGTIMGAICLGVGLVKSMSSSKSSRIAYPREPEDVPPRMSYSQYKSYM